MRRFAVSALAILALAGAADAKPRLTGEAELAKLLQGRVAEAPVECITTWPSSQMQVIDGTAIVFGRGDVIYVNRTAHPRDIDDDEILVLKKYGNASRLCRVDLITTIDQSSHMFSGNVFLTQFVPYRRVR